MTVFILFVGILNLSIGYALAVYLGYGPATLREAWVALTGNLGQVVAPERSLVEQLAEVPTEEFLDTMLDDAMEDALEDDWDDGPDDEAYAAPDEEEVAELMALEAAQDWDLNEKYVETSLLKLNIAMMKSGARATELDTRLRAMAGKTDLETVQTCMAELLEDCETYLGEQSEAADEFAGRVGELGELSELGEEVETANLEQAAQIETTISNLKHMDFVSDLESANGRLLEEIANLRIARHKLRDSQEVAFLTIARYENRLAKIEKQLYNDPLTRLRNRIGLETTLHGWWEDGRHKSRQMSAVLLGVDAFGDLNERYGLVAGNRILYQLGQTIGELIGDADMAARFAGDEFLIMMLDVGPRAATKTAELIRQTVEKTCFVFAGKRIRTTFCGGITEISPKDTDQTFIERLEHAIRAAKKEGADQAFFHDGRDMQLIESPNLGAALTDITI
ncbi:MAG: diguanylate cyclase [Planctomycetes bacterium]|nr:diguanylate cyclase [Planctomycetota bacterium]